LRILFDKNVPVGARSFLTNHQVFTFAEMGSPDQLANGELLRMAEQAGFDVMVASDQNVLYQQNLAGRKISLIVLGSNIWPIVEQHSAAITAAVGSAIPGRHSFIEMPLRPKRRSKES
jgi:hypothetical protein